MKNNHFKIITLVLAIAAIAPYGVKASKPDLGAPVAFESSSADVGRVSPPAPNRPEARKGPFCCDHNSCKASMCTLGNSCKAPGVLQGMCVATPTLQGPFLKKTRN